MTGDIRARRLSAATLEQRFAAVHPPLREAEVKIEAERCYYCYDAPCTAACPTGIDIPGFIRAIAGGRPDVAAARILRANPVGAVCARVCPVETLCEADCVRHTEEDRPVQIGQLQRHAMDAEFARRRIANDAPPPDGHRIAVVGAGPAGLSCAHTLAHLGHRVTVYEARDIPGGLSAHGIAAYKVLGDVVQREVDYLTGNGNVELRTGVMLGRHITLNQLRREHDAVFIGIGLQNVAELGIEGEALTGVEDAVRYIERLRKGPLEELEVGRRVVVIGGGMTAIDIAVQSRLLGAEEVHLCYRRGPETMGASPLEQQLARDHGVFIHHWLRPLRIDADNGAAAAVSFARTAAGPNGLTDTGETLTLPADQVFKAIGQRLDTAPLGDGAPLDAKARLTVDARLQTPLPGVWAGGDCVGTGDDLTVVAAEDGKRAARAIHAWLAAREDEA
ncbi:NAD(P)-dependent oxidoreductase [Acidihalobacter ferrooxydans]|uniref:dihydrouracil dehydrogenase (NAD(+)) n=1 Tax=Acidihalobacter ferrooxydans TaxID=1765967 RepID=A0A1P8UGJ0_9GAMM|nr:NAD(P)-dependent oxidoreductase [Acidihalobacter ferrooxydans]APZ42935.1 hypothetical protein BW247_07390 [Acidihalobacter ferrooxydans]